MTNSVLPGGRTNILSCNANNMAGSIRYCNEKYKKEAKRLMQLLYIYFIRAFDENSAKRVKTIANKHLKPLRKNVGQEDGFFNHIWRFRKEFCDYRILDNDLSHRPMINNRAEKRKKWN